MAEHDPQRDEAIDAVLAEFNGDYRAAIKALLHDIDVLARDAENVSRGFVRRQRLFMPPKRSQHR